MTEVKAVLVLQNVGRSVVHFELLTLFAYDPVNGTLFDTSSHTNVQLNPGETRSFSETTRVTGRWSEVAFTVKVFSKRSTQLGAVSRSGSARDLDRSIVTSHELGRCGGRLVDAAVQGTGRLTAPL